MDAPPGKLPHGRLRLAAAALFAAVPPAMMGFLFFHPSATQIFVAVTAVAAFACSLMAGFLVGTRWGKEADSQVGLGCLASIVLLALNAGLFVLGVLLVR